MVIKFKSDLIHQFAHKVDAQPANLQLVNLDFRTAAFVFGRNGWVGNICGIKGTAVILQGNAELAAIYLPANDDVALVFTLVSVFDDVGTCFVAGEFDVKYGRFIQACICCALRDKSTDILDFIITPWECETLFFAHK